MMVGTIIRAKTAMIIPMMLLVVALAGCATDDLSKVYQYRAVFTQSELSITRARQAGRISDEALVAVEPAVLTARKALDEAEADASDDDGRVTTWAFVRAAMGSLKYWTQFIERAKP